MSGSVAGDDAETCAEVGGAARHAVVLMRHELDALAATVDNLDNTGRSLEASGDEPCDPYVNHQEAILWTGHDVAQSLGRLADDVREIHDLLDRLR